MIIYSKLENGKKVLYERVIDGEDVKLTYVDETGAPLTLVDKDTYKCAPERTIKRTSDGKMVNVMSGDTCLIGKAPQTHDEALSEDNAEEIVKG